MFIKFLLRPAAKFKILHRNLTPGGRGWRTVVAKLPERPVWKVDLIWYIFHLCCFTMRGWTQHRQHWIYIVTIYFLCPDTQSYKFTQIIYNDPCSFQCNDNDSSALQEILKEYLEVSSYLTYLTRARAWPLCCLFVQRRTVAGIARNQLCRVRVQYQARSPPPPPPTCRLSGVHQAGRAFQEQIHASNIYNALLYSINIYPHFILCFHEIFIFRIRLSDVSILSWDRE